MISLSVRIVIGTALACSLAVPLRAEEATTFDPGVARRITPEEVQRRRDGGEKALIVDTRSRPSDVIVRGAVHVPNDRTEVWAKDVPKDALIVTYCT